MHEIGNNMCQSLLDVLSVHLERRPIHPKKMFLRTHLKTLQLQTKIKHFVQMTFFVVVWHYSHGVIGSWLSTETHGERMNKPELYILSLRPLASKTSPVSRDWSAANQQLPNHRAGHRLFPTNQTWFAWQPTSNSLMIFRVNPLNLHGYIVRERSSLLRLIHTTSFAHDIPSIFPWNSHDILIKLS